PSRPSRRRRSRASREAGARARGRRGTRPHARRRTCTRGNPRPARRAWRSVRLRASGVRRAALPRPDQPPRPRRATQSRRAPRARSPGCRRRVAATGPGGSKSPNALHSGHARERGERKPLHEEAERLPWPARNVRLAGLALDGFELHHVERPYEDLDPGVRGDELALQLVEAVDTTGTEGEVTPELGVLASHALAEPRARAGDEDVPSQSHRPHLTRSVHIAYEEGERAHQNLFGRGAALTRRAGLVDREAVIAEDEEQRVRRQRLGVASDRLGGRLGDLRQRAPDITARSLEARLDDVELVDFAGPDPQPADVLRRSSAGRLGVGVDLPGRTQRVDAARDRLELAHRGRGE